MSTQNGLDDPYGSYAIAFNVEMLQTQIFGAFYSVVQFRRNTTGVTNAEIARRGGWTRSMITKNLGSPSNWTLKTISELATALDVDLKFCLVDRTDASRSFDANGILFDFDHIPQGEMMGQSQSASKIRNVARGHNRNMAGDEKRLFEIQSLERVGLETSQL